MLQSYDTEYSNHSYWFFQSFYITEQALFNFLFSTSSAGSQNYLDNPAEQRVQHLKADILWHQHVAKNLQEEVQRVEKAILTRKMSGMMAAADSLNQSNMFDQV